MKALRIAIGVVLAAGAAACSNASSPVLPAGASFSGGHTLGSGAGVTPPPTGSTATMSSDTTGRGGHTLGGGAREQEQQTTGTSDATERGGHTLGSGS